MFTAIMYTLEANFLDLFCLLFAIKFRCIKHPLQSIDDNTGSLDIG